MEKIFIYTIITIAVVVNGYKTKFFTQNLESEPPISILYARDKNSDKVTHHCLTEMYPRNLYKYPLRIDRNDIPCIIHCVLKKFGIMTNDGFINIKNYYKRVQAIHRYDPRILISDVGETCAQNINGMNLDHDVCKKAKVFNDCTQLYAVSYRDPDEWEYACGIYATSDNSLGRIIRHTLAREGTANFILTPSIHGKGSLLFTLIILISYSYARISVMYTHDKLSDMIAKQCLNEMFPKYKHIDVQESDESCIIFCVLKKFGIISANGAINLENYRKRVQIAQQLDERNLIGNYGNTCMENAEATQHKQDVCKKAKVFNDCTHLYRILLK